MLRVAVALAAAVAHVHGSSLAYLVAPLADPHGSPPGDDGRAAFVRPVCRAALRLLLWATAWAGKGPLGALLAARAPADVARALSHDALLWSAYLAAAFGLACETFVRALADDSGVSQPLNLLSFSFLLHVHSSAARTASLGGGFGLAGDDDVSPSSGASARHAAVAAAAHKDADDVIGLASAQLYIYLVTILLELASLQLSYCAHFWNAPSLSAPGTAAPHRTRTSPRKYRLPITALFSLVQQAFAMRSFAVLWGWVDASPERRMLESDQFGTVWLNKVPELCFEVVVASSVAVKALAAAIRGEELSFDNLVGHPVMSPTSEEDYPVALIKYVTHLLSTTRLSGLALELHPLDVLPLSLSIQLETLGLVDPPSCGDPLCDLHGPAVRAQQERERARAQGAGVVLGRAGNVAFDDGPATLAPPGLAREVRRISVAGIEGDDADAQHAGAGRRSTASLAHLEGERKNALWRLIVLVARCALYVVWRVATTVKRAARRAAYRGSRWARRAAAVFGWKKDETALERRWSAERRRRGDTPLAAAPVVELERAAEEDGESTDDEDWVPSSASAEGDDDDGPSSSEWESDVDDTSSRVCRGRSPTPAPDADDADVPYALFADAGPDGEALAPYLLAHQVARTASRPLTRRRYRSLLPSSSSGAASSRTSHAPPHDPVEALSTAIAARRGEVLASLPGVRPAAEELEAARDKWRDERARFCVVCQVEDRTIVLWPCRCLCLCEDCRASLADRATGGNGGQQPGAPSSGGGALCPTCRSEVQGFSRIYVP
ncbi:uncharacterized protein RHOBADRAFT_54399 [Rhodotorula graminis WP1]|uniref:RING-type domain-containing protein n=1 Tax=Rhodotorula graminis (strain WP1) TaxID=578459 RepID=A0A0P9EJL3_RHOGW|nr:uncharacterized protein RHOBADRAFT_54399 [Rhodotorula graminis WP1]KPV73802.1 hypothetical protein RHOBADRAFT_54399 [Rhodotorula graminis WP1]